jgi:SpoVK/Ycf46/Vps4 family AAA+-type ATPase
MGKGRDGNDDDSDEEARDSWTKTFDPTCSVKLVEASDPPLSWDDYFAEEDVKAQLQQICSRAEAESSDGKSVLEDMRTLILRNVRRVTRGSVSSPPANARHVVLLHGKPGCGKTQAVRVMANVVAKSTVRVYFVDLTSIKSTWLGQAEHQLKIVLKHIAELKNAVVFIDEIDAFVGSNLRQSVHGSPLLMEFLQWINGIDPISGNITIICATNFMEICDPAFLSRCTHKIEIPPASRELRLKWWNARARQLTQGQRESLAKYEVESFRCLGQLVDEAEETLARTKCRAPRYGDYRKRLVKIATLSSFKQGSEDQENSFVMSDVGSATESRQIVEIDRDRATLDQDSTTFAYEIFEQQMKALERHEQANLDILEQQLKALQRKFEARCSTIQQSLDESRQWDSVDVTWTIDWMPSLWPATPAIRHIYSESFLVAQHTLKLLMTVKREVASQSTMNTGGGEIQFVVGLFVKNIDKLPIQIDGTELSLIGLNNASIKTKRFQLTPIEGESPGRGWDDFASLKQIDDPYVRDGKITVEAKVRARRTTKIQVKTSTE